MDHCPYQRVKLIKNKMDMAQRNDMQEVIANKVLNKLMRPNSIDYKNKKIQYSSITVGLQREAVIL